ncbi:P-loop containing nucleoside triphosphate hydrolase protein [Aspergillus insuetus]
MSLTLCISIQCRRTTYSHLLDPVQWVHGLTPSAKSLYPARRYYTPRRSSTHSDVKHSASLSHDTGTDFIGREKDLEKLWNSLRPQEPPKRRAAVLHGRDGVGKTRLAARFAQLHVDDFRPIWWVDGSSNNAMLASLGKLATQIPTSEIVSYLSQPTSGGGILERRASMVSGYLRNIRNARWLLVVDGLAANKVKLDDFVTGGDQGSILVTTTSPQPQVLLGENHVVNPLSPADALAFLTRLTSDQASRVPNSEAEEQARKILVRHLDGLPLALVLAAAYIQQTGLSTSSYLSLYLEAGRAAPAREQCPLETACKLSYQEVKLLNPLAANILLLLSCYNHTDIPSSLLEYARHLTQTDAILQTSGHELQQAIRTLQNFSLITINHGNGWESYNIHPMIQTSCRSMLTTNEQEQQKLHSTALFSFGKMTAATVNPQEPSVHVEHQSFLPHADEMQHLVQSNSSLPPSSKTLEALMTIGKLYHDQGLLNYAEGVYLHGMSHSENLHGPWHPTRRRIIKSLRHIRFQRGRMGQLIAQYKWAFVLLRAWELLAGSVLIVLSIGTWLILAIIMVFVWLVIRLTQMVGQTDSDKGLHLDGTEKVEDGTRV